MLLNNSKFLPYFLENKERLNNGLQLIGDILLVERIQFPEKKVGSLFIADSKRIMVGGLTTETPNFYRVLLVGRGFYNAETNADEPLDVNQSDIIYTGAASVKLWSSFPALEIVESDILGVTRHSDIQMRWTSEAAFLDFLTSFNESVQENVKKTNRAVVL